MKVFVLNTPVLTEFGRYDFKKITLEEARAIIKDGFISAVGHKGAAEFLTKIFGIEIPYNRVPIHMGVGDIAVVLRVLVRLPEGKILSAEEIDSIPYELGLLERIG